MLLLITFLPSNTALPSASLKNPPPQPLALLFVIVQSLIVISLWFVIPPPWTAFKFCSTFVPVIKAVPFDQIPEPPPFIQLK